MKEGPVFCIAVFAIAKGLIVAVNSYLIHIGMSMKGPTSAKKASARSHILTEGLLLPFRNHLYD